MKTPEDIRERIFDTNQRISRTGTATNEVIVKSKSKREMSLERKIGTFMQQEGVEKQNKFDPARSKFHWKLIRDNLPFLMRRDGEVIDVYKELRSCRYIRHTRSIMHQGASVEMNGCICNACEVRRIKDGSLLHKSEI